LSTTADTGPVCAANVEAIEAWDGPLFERFVQYRDIIVVGLKQFGDEAMRLYPPPRGGRVLDIGCGFGDTTRQLAEHAGPEGFAVGVDAAPRFIEAARAEAAQAGVTNARFDVMDVEAAPFTERFDYAFSRMGTMFFANPVAALRNVRESLSPGARLVMVVWRAKEDNDWVYRAQQITERFVTKPDEYEEPTCGPGPFSMANADTTSAVLVSAGFEDITFRRCDLSLKTGQDLDEAVAFTMDLGPAGEILRLQGQRAAHLHEPIRQALREGMAQFAGPDGVLAPASAWIVSCAAARSEGAAPATAAAPGIR
jgi:ubiquinone/menaquinone biosynthesis C-methylase UbiE